MAVVAAGFDIRCVPLELQRYFDPEFCRNVLELDLSLFIEGETDPYVLDRVALFGTDGWGRVIAVEVEP